MNLLIKYIFIIFVFVFNLSLAPFHFKGLLTHNYGIVTNDDLDEEKERCPSLKPFPPIDGSCFQYWQCLPTKEVFIACEEIELATKDEVIGAANFWIKDGHKIHHYLTRRNFGFEACSEWKVEWLAVLKDEDIVCLSGEFINIDDHDDRPSSPTGTHYYWIIDRMKTAHKEWSYFYREPKTH